MQNYWLKVADSYVNMNDVHQYKVISDDDDDDDKTYYVVAIVRKFLRAHSAYGNGCCSVSDELSYTILKTKRKDDATKCLKKIMEGDSKYVVRVGENSKSEIDSLKEQIEELTMMVKYHPAGFFAQEAKNHFESINK